MPETEYPNLKLGDGSVTAKKKRQEKIDDLKRRLPRVSTTDRYSNGCDTLTDECLLMPRLPFDEAFEMAYAGDEHFVTYEVVRSGNKNWPRINKPVLPQIRAAGADVVARMLALDWDTPDHQLLTPLLFSEMTTAMAQAADDGFSMAMDWSLMYTSRHGIRLVFVLDEPVPVDQMELHHRWAVEQFCLHGMKVDPRCSDWTRIFRLPFVVRDKIPSWEIDPDQQAFEYLRQPDNFLDTSSLGKSAASIRAATHAQHLVKFEIPKPTPEEGVDLLVALSETRNQTIQSEWYKSARKALKGADCFGCLFKSEAIAALGARNETLHRYVGQAVQRLFALRGTKPQHIYGLFFDAVMDLEPDSGTADWTDELWRSIGTCWSLERAKGEEQRLIAEEEAKTAEQIAANILAGMRNWCDAPELSLPDCDAWGWAVNHLIISVARYYYVMSPNGYYDSLAVNSSQIVPRIKHLGMDLVMPIDIGTDSKDLVNQYATVARDVRSIPQVSGVVVERIDTHTATVVEPSYRRNEKLLGRAEYNPYVDEWLKRLFGSDYELGCTWIAWSLAFEQGPICAVSIKGSPGTGKKMLVQGLAECLEVPATADANDMGDNNQYGLLESPFVVVNEGWPFGTGKGKHPADAFRSLVGGDPLRVGRKFLPPIKVQNPVRMVMTANNFNIVQVLSAGKDLSPEDREALAIRLLHFDVSDDAQIWLRNKGGLRFTGRPGTRWISSDGGNDSDYVIARHFLWLYKNRPDDFPGNRLLVEGNSRDEILFEMRTQTGVTPEVIEALVGMVEKASGRQGLATVDGHVYVTTRSIRDWMRVKMADTMVRPASTSQINKAMTGLSLMDPEAEEHSMGHRVLPGQEDAGRMKWWKIDLETLSQVGSRDGHKTQKLRRLLDEQKKKEFDLQVPELDE